jgi:hypothetical protein
MLHNSGSLPMTLHLATGEPNEYGEVLKCRVLPRGNVRFSGSWVQVSSDWGWPTCTGTLSTLC